MAFHPTPEKALVFAGDKEGNLGIFDGSQSSSIKSEDDSDVEDGLNLSIASLKLHHRPLTSIQFDYSDWNSVYTSSYDSTVRKLDLAKGVSVEAYALANLDENEALSGLEILQSDPHVLRFSTLGGRFGMHDMRESTTRNGSTKVFQLSEKKIGGFSSHPLLPHIVATASLDRTLKLWDLRKLTGRGDDQMPQLLGQHENRLSVSHASFNHSGQLATASYDDTVKIYDFQSVADVRVGSTLSEQELEPKIQIPHNNQTGRWVTMYAGYG
jgi:WD repeat-containing protein 76